MIGDLAQGLLEELGKDLVQGLVEEGGEKIVNSIKSIFTPENKAPAKPRAKVKVKSSKPEKKPFQSRDRRHERALKQKMAKQQRKASRLKDSD